MVEPSVNRAVSDRSPDADDGGDPTSGQLGLGPIQPPSLADRINDGIGRLEAMRERPVLLTAVVSSLLALAVALSTWDRSPAPNPIDEFIPQVTLTPTSAPDAQDAEVVVHVSGAVASPGVYALPESARIIDALEAAGGADSGADFHQLNLAAVVIDGQQIRVPREGETLPPPSDVPGGTGPVDLNRADVVKLQDLPGVGPATAEAIVAFRQEHGRFVSIDDLLDVPGIGPAKLSAIAQAAVVR